MRKTTKRYGAVASPCWIDNASRLEKKSAENATVQVLAVTHGANSSGSRASTETSPRPGKSKRATTIAGSAPTAKATSEASIAMRRLLAACRGSVVDARCASQSPSPSTGSALASR